MNRHLAKKVDDIELEIHKLELSYAKNGNSRSAMKVQLEGLLKDYDKLREELDTHERSFIEFREKTVSRRDSWIFAILSSMTIGAIMFVIGFLM